MRKIVASFILIICTTLLGIGYQSDWMSSVSKWMYGSKSLLGSDKYRYGDLYGLSYYPAFRIEKEEEKLPAYSVTSKMKDINLTIIGDSYTYSFIDEQVQNFERVKDFQFASWEDRNKLKIPSPSTAKNILLIEIVERNAIAKLKEEEFKKCFQLQKDRPAYKEKLSVTVENNLEFLLFEHRLFSSIKEFKTSILHQLFGKIPGDVVLSKDGKNLYLRETMEGETSSNSFNELHKTSYQAFENHVNKMYDKGKALGYDEVWLLIAPNPVRALQTENKQANALFTYLEKSTTLKMKFLNILPALSKHPKSNFFVSDTHWNLNGAYLYRNLVNQELLKH